MNPLDEASDKDSPFRIELSEQQPRVGRPLREKLVLERGASAGDSFQAILTCSRTCYETDPDGDSQSYDDTAYHQSIVVQATREEVRWVEPFAFDVHVTDPPSNPARVSELEFNWRLWMNFRVENSPYTVTNVFPLEVGAAPRAEVRAALAAVETPEVASKIDEYAAKVGADLLPHVRFRFATQPQALEQAIQSREVPERIMSACFNIFFALAVGFFVVMPVLLTAYRIVRHFFGDSAGD
jgi:hypothetical protein